MAECLYCGALMGHPHNLGCRNFKEFAPVPAPIVKAAQKEFVINICYSQQVTVSVGNSRAGDRLPPEVDITFKHNTAIEGEECTYSMTPDDAMRLAQSLANGARDSYMALLTAGLARAKEE